MQYHFDVKRSQIGRASHPEKAISFRARFKPGTYRQNSFKINYYSAPPGHPIELLNNKRCLLPRLWHPYLVGGISKSSSSSRMDPALPSNSRRDTCILSSLRIQASGSHIYLYDYQSMIRKKALRVNHHLLLLQPRQWEPGRKQRVFLSRQGERRPITDMVADFHLSRFEPMRLVLPRFSTSWRARTCTNHQNRYHKCVTTKDKEKLQEKCKVQHF